MIKTDEEFLSLVESNAKEAIEKNAPTASIFLGASTALEWVKHTRHLKDTALELLADKQKIQKQMKETQYLSTLWIQALTDYIPEAKRPDALKAAARLIIEGMKDAGIKEYTDEHLTQLEN